jgi:lipopolysaccharide export LptBFGC system permease protein LptF
MESIQGIITPPPYDAMIYQIFSASRMYYRLPAADSVGTGSTTADDKALPQLWRDLIQAKAIVEQQLYEQKQASLHWLESMHDDYLQNILVDTPQNDQINLFYNRYLQEKSRKISQEFYKAKVIDFYQHFSLPTACFIFTFLAFTIAIQAPKMHQMLVLALGALLCIAYWFSLFLVIHAVMVLNFPLWFVGASDASFLLVAIILYIRLGR